MITPDVLIPRPETEILVEEAVRLLRLAETSRFAEAGAGSGCISVSILHSVPNASATATDISAAALAVARENARRHSVAARLEFLETDLLNGITGPFDLIVSNPPYIPNAQIAGLEPEVREHEPRLALSGGDDGLDIVRRLIDGSPRLLRPGGSLLIEIGFDQSEQVRSLFASDKWHGVEFLPDLQGIPRIAKAMRK
jgi:release factor glutamine methyltransferase